MKWKEEVPKQEGEVKEYMKASTKSRIIISVKAIRSLAWLVFLLSLSSASGHSLTLLGMDSRYATAITGLLFVVSSIISALTSRAHTKIDWSKYRIDEDE